jgi:hypothetical protein
MDLKEKAIEVFKNLPNEQVLHVTADGNVFTEKSENYAKSHAKFYGLEVVTFKREELLDEPKADKAEGTDEANPFEGLTVAGVTQLAATIESVEVLEKALTVVTTKGGIDAINARIAALKA